MSKIKNLLTTQRLNQFASLTIQKDQWVFSSTENRHFDSNSRYLFVYVYEHLTEITPVYVMNDKKKREELQNRYPRAKIVDTDTRDGIRTVLESGVWFTSAGLPVYGVGLAKKRVIVNLWHGVPLKKIVLAENKKHLLYRMFFPLVFSRNYTWVLTTSSRLVSVMQESFGIRKEQVKVWGQPRNDGLFRIRKAREVLSEIYQDLPEFTKAVLYAPTHREGDLVRLFPFEDFQEQKLLKFLEQEKLLLCIRTHLYTQKVKNLPDSPRIRWLNEDRAEDVMEVLDVFDLLITDYSSIYIDFLLTGKPQIFLPYDKQEYLAQRGLNFSYDKVTPGPKPETFGDFCIQVKELLEGEDGYEKMRGKIGRFFNEVEKPCCAQICSQVQKYLES